MSISTKFKPGDKVKYKTSFEEDYIFGIVAEKNKAEIADRDHRTNIKKVWAYWDGKKILTYVPEEFVSLSITRKLPEWF